MEHQQDTQANKVEKHPFCLPPAQYILSPVKYCPKILGIDPWSQIQPKTIIWPIFFILPISGILAEIFARAHFLDKKLSSLHDTV